MGKAPATVWSALALLVAGCSGTAASPEGYLHESAAIAADYRAEADRLGADYEARLAGIETDTEQGQREFARLTLDYFQEALPEYGRTVDRLAGLSPPGEMSDAHDAWVEARRSYHELLGEVGDRLHGAATVDDVSRAVNGVGLAAGKLAVDRACRAVEAAAGAAGLQADLDCPDPDG